MNSRLCLKILKQIEFVIGAEVFLVTQLDVKKLKQVIQAIEEASDVFTNFRDTKTGKTAGRQSLQAYLLGIRSLRRGLTNSVYEKGQIAVCGGAAMKIKKLIPFICTLILLPGCGQTVGNKVDTAADISSGKLRKEVFALVSSAENSSTDYAAQYAYIEDIGDGRGYTAGIIGFTTGTGDLLEVVKRYTELKPENELKQYIPALEKVNGTDSHDGLGDAFVCAWEKAAQSEEMIQAQNDILDEQYMNVALRYAEEDGLRPLGQYIYYDALVVHGSGDSEDSFEAIRNAALEKEKAPSDGGDETAFLTAFLDARVPVMQMEAAHSDLSRLDAQRKFLNEKNFNLALPLEWTMYGEAFSLTVNPMDEMP